MAELGAWLPNWRRFFLWSGRIGRRGFFGGYIAVCFVSGAAGMVGVGLLTLLGDFASINVVGLVLIGTGFIPLSALFAQRAHDVGISAIVPLTLFLILSAPMLTIIDFESGAFGYALARTAHSAQLSMAAVLPFALVGNGLWMLFAIALMLLKGQPHANQFGGSASEHGLDAASVWLPARSFAILAVVGVVMGIASLTWNAGVRDCGIGSVQRDGHPNLLIRACAAVGYAPAQRSLGAFYWSVSGDDPAFHGLDPRLTEPDMHRLGRVWLESAAREGDGFAQNELGLAHLDAEFGMNQDFGAARYWLELAAQRGDQIAPYNLARMHYSGRGYSESEAQAEAMLRLSALRGYRPALCSLAELLERRSLGVVIGEVALLRRQAQSMDPGEPCAPHELMDELNAHAD